MNILLKIFIPVLLISCSKPKECFQPEVDLKYDVYPRKEIFKIGDSILFTAVIDKFTTDVDDGRFVNTFDFNLFSGSIGIKGYLDNHEQYAAWSHFKYKVLKGSEEDTNPYVARRFNFMKRDSGYIFEVVIYPQKKGAFTLSTSEIRGKNGSCNILFGYPKPLFPYNQHHLYERVTGTPANVLDIEKPYFFMVE